MAEQSMLTTVDNPYNPFDHWDEWYTYDRHAGYYTSELLARIARESDELSDEDQSLAIEDAITEIIREDVLGLYRRVYATDDTATQAAEAVAILNKRKAA